MGGSASNIVNPIIKVVTAPITGGFGLLKSKYNPLDKSFDPLGARKAARDARNAAAEQAGAMAAEEAALVTEKKETKKSKNNLAIRQRLLAQRGYAAANTRGGTILTSPTGLPPTTGGTGSKVLLGT